VFKKLLSIFLLTVISIQSHAEFRDPTRPAYPVNKIEAMTTDIEKEPQLSAIWILQRSRWATLNGIQAKQGQIIAGNIKIIKISKNAVTINQNGTVKTLQLLQRHYKSQ
jgi:hypothetical protein